MTRTIATIRRGMLAALVLGVGAAVLGGCAQAVPVSHPSGTWITARDADKEYRKAAATLTLAAHAQWPTDPESSKGPDGAPQYYQVGAATNDAQFYWFCSWTAAAAAENTPAFDEQASDALEQVTHLRLGGTGSDDNTKQLLDAVRAAVASHDVRAVDDFNEKNCVASG